MKLLFTAILLVFLSLQNFAQTEKSLSRERFDEVYDSLLVAKRNLQLEKQILTSEIDSLQNLLVELEEKVSSSRTKQLVRKYGKKNGLRIARGQVWKGMSEKMLEDSWGKPDKITRNKEKWGTFTQWYSGDITYFFRDGFLTDWEEKK